MIHIHYLSLPFSIILASFKKLSIDIIELSPKNRIYFYDTVLLISPFFKYERYDSLDNIQTVFGKDGSNLTAANDVNADFNLVIEIANYIKGSTTYNSFAIGLIGKWGNYMKCGINYL